MWCHILWWECCNFVEVANSAQMVWNMKLLDVKVSRCSYIPLNSQTLLPDFDKIQDGVQVLTKTLLVVLSVLCD
jgi:hypothetical protein